MGITCKKDRALLIFTNDDTGKQVKYDLTDGQCYGVSGKKVKNINAFFAHYAINDIEWTNEVYKKFVASINRKSRCCNIGSLLEQLKYYANLEGYLLQGIEFESVPKHPINYYPKPVIKYIKRITQHQPEYNVSRILSLGDKDFYLHKEFLQFIQVLQHLDNPECLLKLDRWEIEVVLELTQTYSMDMKSLLLKLIYYINNEGLDQYTAIRNLRDYNSMLSQMSPKYDKYPRYLLSTHAIAVKNYNSFKLEHSKELFEKNVDTTLEHNGKIYSVIMPKLPIDVQQEGGNLHHCVASYVDNISNGKTQIAFLRLNTALDKSLVTLEIKDRKIIQAKGMYNRAITEDELTFLNTYAKIKKLKVGTYL